MTRASGARAIPRRDRYKSDLERQYAAHLEAKRIRGEIERWDYEEVKLRIADETWIVIDFRVILPDLTQEMHETKGFRREKDMIKLKAVAERHPYRFYLVSKKGGVFELTLYE